MAITYKQIAQLCGVSRATVDRVIHNRGKVNPEVAKRILQVAQEYNFKPNEAGRALALSSNPIKIGVLVHLTRIHVFQKVLEGVHLASTEIRKLGGEVLVKAQEGFDSETQLMLLNELVEEGVKGIALSPTQDVRLRNRLDELTAMGMPIVTLNTELHGISKLCHVGVDNMKGGRIAAYLMDLLLRGTGGKVLVISGHLTQQSNFQRVNGFISECDTYFPKITAVDLQFNADREDAAYEITQTAIKNIPDLSGILMISCGQEGVCRALEDTGMAGKIQLITYDLSPTTKEYLKKGVIQIIIDQDAYEQGNLPPRILFDYLFNHQTPSNPRILSEFGVITPYNIS